MSTEEIPKWTDRVLQGVAFWIGYRRQYYRHHDLTEGAIVSEVCNLLNACISDDQKLFCEVPYWHLLKKSRGKGAGRDNSTDLVIAGQHAKSNRELADTEQVIIEVKRYVAGKQKIWDDIVRLATLLEERADDLKAYVILVSEAKKLDEKILNKNSEANRKIQSVTSKSKSPIVACYKVRRVCKATSSFKPGAPDHAHYACLIEIKGLAKS